VTVKFSELLILSIVDSGRVRQYKFLNMLQMHPGVAIVNLWPQNI